MELILIKITSLPTENQEASICSQAIPYMRSDIFNFVYHLLNNEFLNNSEQEHFLLVKGNVLSRFQAHFFKLHLAIKRSFLFHFVYMKFSKSKCKCKYVEPVFRAGEGNQQQFPSFTTESWLSNLIQFSYLITERGIQ